MRMVFFCLFSSGIFSTCMKLRAIDDYYFSKEESIRSCLLALRNIILLCHHDMSETWKYNTPCFELKGVMCCYLWIDKKRKWPYLGVVKGCEIEHPDLESEGLKQIKKYYVNPEKDIQIKKMNEILQAMVLYYELNE